MNQIFQMRYYASLKLKGLKNYWRSKLGVWRINWSYLTLVPTFSSWRWFVRQFFSRFATLTSSSFAALWATRMHSTSFERSDSYLFGFSLKIGISALFRYFISAQRYVIYLILRVHRANQTPLAFFEILERSWPLTSIFCFESADICCVYWFFKRIEPF